MTNEVQLLTTSRWKTFKRCKRMHYYLYEIGVTTEEVSVALNMGIAAHDVLERWFLKREQWNLYPDADLDDESLWKLRAMMEGYDCFYDQDEFTTIATELEFNLPLLNPKTGRRSRIYNLAGKVDAIVKDKNERYWLVEHKTTSMDASEGSQYWQRLFLDEQVGIYLHALKRLGYPVEGCIYDVLKKPTAKPKLETPDEKKKYTKGKDGKLRLYKGQRDNDEPMIAYYERLMEAIAKDPTQHYVRATVVRTEDDEQRLMHDLWFAAHEMTRHRKSQTHPTDSEACFKYNRKCKFFDLCCNTSDLSDDRWIKKEKIHSELQAKFQGERTNETKSNKTLHVL